MYSPRFKKSHTAGECKAWTLSSQKAFKIKVPTPKKTEIGTNTLIESKFFPTSDPSYTITPLNESD